MSRINHPGGGTRVGGTLSVSRSLTGNTASVFCSVTEFCCCAEMMDGKAVQHAKSIKNTDFAGSGGFSLTPESRHF